MPSAPINVLARNVGNGNLEVRWDPVAGLIDHYDIYIATSLGGTYVKANKLPVTFTKETITNLPFNSLVYVKVTATDNLGVESALSTAADDADCSRALMDLTFTAPIGSQIPIGAMFAEFVGDSHLVAFRTTASGSV